MLEKRSAIDGCVADLEMAQKTLYQISNGQGASEEQIHKAAIHAKRLELKLAVAKLGHAEYYLSSLSARRLSESALEPRRPGYKDRARGIDLGARSAADQ
jgi:hypothetical protein